MADSLACQCRKMIENERSTREQVDKQVIDLLRDVKNRYQAKMNSYKTGTVSNQASEPREKDTQSKEDDKDNNGWGVSDKADDGWGESGQSQAVTKKGKNKNNNKKEKASDKESDKKKESDGWAQQDDGWGQQNNDWGQQNDDKEQKDDWAQKDEGGQNDSWGQQTDGWGQTNNDWGQQNDDKGQKDNWDQKNDGGQKNDWGWNTSDEKKKTTEKEETSKKDETSTKEGTSKKDTPSKKETPSKKDGKSKKEDPNKGRDNANEPSKKGQKNESEVKAKGDETEAADIKEIRSQLLTAKLDLRLMERDKTNIAKERDDLLKQLEQVTKKNSKLETELTQAKNLIKTLKEGCALVESQAKTYESRHDNAVMSKADLERELIAIKEESSRHITTINNLQKSNELISKAFLDSVASHDELKKEFTRRLEECKLENIKLIQANDQLGKVIDFLRQKN